MLFVIFFEQNLKLGKILVLTFFPNRSQSAVCGGALEYLADRIRVFSCEKLKLFKYHPLGMGIFVIVVFHSLTLKCIGPIT